MDRGWSFDVVYRESRARDTRTTTRAAPGLRTGVKRSDDGARAVAKVRAAQQAILSSGSRRFEVSEEREVHRAREFFAPRMHHIIAIDTRVSCGKASRTLRSMGRR